MMTLTRNRFRPKLESLEERWNPFTYDWTGAAMNGKWNDKGNWTSTDGGTTFPSSSADTAFIGNAITAPTTITLDSVSITTSKITIEAPHSVTITATAGKTLALTSGTPVIVNNTPGTDNHTFLVPVQFNANSLITNNSDGLLTFTQALDPAMTRNWRKTGVGPVTLTLTGMQNPGSNSGFLRAEQGTLTLNGTGKVGRTIWNPGTGGELTIADVGTTGALTIRGELVFNSQVAFNVDINGLTAGAAVDGYDQTIVQGYGTGAGQQGSVNLNNAVLNVGIAKSFIPPIGSSYTIIDRTGSFSTSSKIDGTFVGLPNGAVFLIDGYQFRINYTTDTVTLTRVNITSFTIAGGSGQSTTVTNPFANPLQAKAADLDGNGVANVAVTFSAPTTGATGTFPGGLSTITVLTDATGIATAPTFTANTKTGAYTVTGSLGPISLGFIPPINFTLTNTPGGAVSVTPLAGTTPQSAIVNTAYGTKLGVLVTDAGGNPVSGQNVVFSVTPAMNGASWTYPGDQTVPTDGSGIATLPVTANTIAGTFTVTATVGALPPVTFTLTNTPGAPDAVVTVAGTPQTVGVEQPFPVAFQAQVADSFGNPISGVIVTFTAPATGASGTFPGGLKVVTAVTDASGTATAPTFTANDVAGSYQVLATVVGVAVPAEFDLTNAFVALPLTVVGSAAGSPGIVKVFEPDGSVRFTLTPFGVNYRGGVTVTTGDLNGDGQVDVVVGQASGVGLVKVFDGSTGLEILSFRAAGPGGVSVAVGDLDGVGLPEIVVGRRGLRGQVLIYDANGVFQRSFLAFPLGGVNVATGDFTGNGLDDIVVGRASGNSSAVRVFDGQTAARLLTLNRTVATLGGITVAAGDIDGDAIADIVVGVGLGSAKVAAFGSTIGYQKLYEEVAFPARAGGVRVALVDADNNGQLDLLAGVVRTFTPQVQILDATNPSIVLGTIAEPDFLYGVFVG